MEKSVLDNLYTVHKNIMPIKVFSNSTFVFFCDRVSLQPRVASSTFMWLRVTLNSRSPASHSQVLGLQAFRTFPGFCLFLEQGLSIAQASVATFPSLQNLFYWSKLLISQRTEFQLRVAPCIGFYKLLGWMKYSVGSFVRCLFLLFKT